MEITPTHLTLVVPTKPAARSYSLVMVCARGFVERFWRALIARARRKPKLLLVGEASALGDRRFVAVVQFERQRFLIGSSPSSVTLLARLPDASAISEGGDAIATTEGEGQ